ncbi:MAG: GH25 family lysozyme [Mycobacteriales bacterium]
MSRRVVLAALLAAAVASGAAGAEGAGAAGALGGPDVASYQHPGGMGIDWAAVAASGQRFAIIKATEGTYYTNPYFASDWAGAGAAHLDRAGYHFAEPSLPPSSAAAQAVYFIHVLGTTRELGDFPPILDLEVTGGLSPPQLIAWTQTFLTTVSDLTGRVPVIYTDPSFWEEAMGDTTAFASYPLWIADYGPGSPPEPGGWSSWTLWQYTDNASVPGIGTAADRSWFCCDAAALAGFADGRTGAIVAEYRSLDGPAGFLGQALGPEFAVPGGWAQRYQGGQILYSPASGAHYVRGAILARYLASGGAAGQLGLPTTDERGVPAAAGARMNAFQGGQIYWSRHTGAHAVTGPVLASWLREGGAGSPDGLPTGDLAATAHGGESQSFRGGRFYLVPRGQLSPLEVFELHGVMLTKYDQVGGPAGVLGLPASEAFSTGVGAQQDFASGLIAYFARARQAVAL